MTTGALDGPCGSPEVGCEALQQMQLGQHERAQLAPVDGRILQVQWAPGGADHHALDRFLRAHQRNAGRDSQGCSPAGRKPVSYSRDGRSLRLTTRFWHRANCSNCSPV